MIEAFILIATSVLPVASLFLVRYSLILARLWLILLAILVGFIAIPSGWLLRLLALIPLVTIFGFWLSTGRIAYFIRRIRQIDDEWWEKAQVSGWEEIHQGAILAINRTAFLKNPEDILDELRERDRETEEWSRNVADRLMAKAGYQLGRPEALKDNLHWIRFAVFLGLLQSGHIEAKDWTPPRAILSRWDRLDQAGDED